MKNKPNRRNFLKKSIAAGALSMSLPYYIPSKVLASPGRRVGANDKVILGGIGTGSRFRGGLARSFTNLDGVEFAAVADVDLKRAQDGQQLAGGPNIDAYQDYRYILDRQDIDAVVIASPDHWHAQHSIEAAMAGKDIYCEKALTLTVEEGRAMVDATRRFRRVLQTGSQQRSWPGRPNEGPANDFPFYRAVMLIRNGYLGKINRVVGVNYAGAWENALPGQPVPEGVDWDMWLGPVQPHPYNENLKPGRANPGWLSIKDFCGGEICGWGAHGLDQIQWALDADESGPEEVWVEGIPYKPWVANSESGYGRFFGAKETIIHYTYPGNIHVELSEDANPNGGALFIGEKGKIKFDRAGITEISDPSWLEIPLEEMKIQIPKITNHSQDFIDSIKDRSKPIADVEIGHRSATVGHLGNIARWVSERTQEVGVKMKWDPKTEKFTNSQWGNFYLSRPRRKGYELPKLV